MLTWLKYEWKMIREREKRKRQKWPFLVIIVVLLFTYHLISDNYNIFSYPVVYNITDIGVSVETYNFFLNEERKWDVGQPSSMEHFEVPKTVRMPDGRQISLLQPSKTYVVPNIVHFVWFGRGHVLKFYQMLSIVSTYLFVKPDSIYFHCDYEPVGYWWKYVKRRVKNLKILAAVPPWSILGRRVTYVSHYSDIYRMFLMYNIGGIYFDTDILGLKPFDDLRLYNLTLGLEFHPIDGEPGHVNTGIIVAAKNAEFLNIWWNTYKNFSYLEHDYHACEIPYALMQKYPQLVHIEEKTLNYPNGKNSDLLYDKLYDYSKNYAMHMWFEHRKSKYNPQNIKRLNTTFAQVARAVYYNTTDFVD